VRAVALTPVGQRGDDLASEADIQALVHAHPECLPIGIGRARARKSHGDSDGLWDLVKIIKTFREAKAFRPPSESEFPLVKKKSRDAGNAADLFLRF
jgi:hypothetical protein